MQRSPGVAEDLLACRSLIKGPLGGCALAACLPGQTTMQPPDPTLVFISQGHWYFVFG